MRSSPRLAKPLSENALNAGGRRAALEFGIVTLVWGSTWLVIKGQLGVVPPAWSVAYRFALAAVVLAVFVAASGRWRALPSRGHALAAMTGCFQFALNFNLVYAAETRLASGVVALVFALLVVPNALLAAIFLKTRLTLEFTAGALVAFGGMALLFAPDLAASAAGAPTGVGILLVVAAVLSASVGNVLQAGPLARSLPFLPTLAASMAYGAAFAAGFAALADGPPRFDVRPSYWLGLVYLAVVASVAAFSLYYGLIRRVGPGRAAYINVLTPILALLLSTVFENFRWTASSIAGATLALVGVAIALGSGRAVTGRRATPRGSSSNGK